MEEPAAKKPGLNARAVLMVFGGICAAVVLVLVVIALVTAPATNRNLKVSRAFAERLIMAVMSDWNADSLRARASDEFLKSVPKGQTDDLVARLGARLGPVRSLGEPRWTVLQTNAGIVVTYTFPATFTKAAGTISLRLVQQGREWKMTTLNVTSDSLRIE